MSQSPSNEVGLANDDYFAAWKKISRLTRQGFSWSGHERNCCFLNTGDVRFADVSAAAGLDFEDDSRAIGRVDWDHDGDLDLWIVNRTGPQVRFLRNDVAGNNHSVALRLQGTTSNRDAIGARIELHLPSGKRLVQTLHAGEGYLGQSSKWLHFGLAAATHIERVVVRWPGGVEESFTGLRADGRYRIVQGSGAAQLTKPRERQVALAAGALDADGKATDRIVFTRRERTSSLAEYLDLEGRSVLLRDKFGGPLLVNVWATWCQPCVAELRELAEHESRIRDHGLKIIALAFPKSAGSELDEVTAIGDKLVSLGYPFDAGILTAEMAHSLDSLQNEFVVQKRPMAVPTSFLLDADGRLAVIYRGRVSVDQLLADLALLTADRETLRDAAVPFAGRWRPPTGE